MKKKYFVPLTGLRTIAASMVFFHHFNPFKQGSFLFNFVNEFHIGVTVFFVLSGFLIGFRYSDKNINYKQYFTNRFARIYPVFFIITVLTYIVYPALSKFELFLNFTLLKGFFQDYKFSGISQGWTLTVEECFYAFALLLFFLVKKNKISLIVILPFILLLSGFLMTLIFKNYNFNGFINNMELVVNYTFLGRSFEFISGFLVAHYLPKLKSNFKYFTYIGVIGMFISIILLIHFKGNNDFGIRTIQGKLINNYFLPVFGVIPLIYGLISERNIISKLLSTDFFELLGKSSYTFYLVYMGVIQIFISTFIPSYFILFIVMQILSIVIFRYYEEPMNTLIKKMFAKRESKLMTLKDRIE
ncbi:acyltransferase [Chryseobacterium sp.]|uniref:acyltransferase family protein n=1 Tax=Chryseobacterium sp. TaxID=1871047 RepID=UPI00321ABD04